MLSESEFQTLATQTLEAILEEIEANDEQMQVDIELSDSGLEMELESGQQYVLSKHTPMRQLWLSSPVSGGTHYDYYDETQEWQSQSGVSLTFMLQEELRQLIGLRLEFSLP